MARARSHWLTLGIAALTIVLDSAGLSSLKAQAQPPSAPASSPAALPLTAIKDGGAVRALLIGIDRYKVQSPLDGAVADAEDLATVLARGGAQDVTLLRDAQATRSAVRQAVDGLITRVQPGDLVVLAFSGHGARRPEAVPGSEPDGLDEFFVLWGYEPTGPGRDDLLLDNEMREVVAALARRGAETLYLADSCFGGGMTKDPNLGGANFKTRALFDISLIGAAKTVADRVTGGDRSVGRLAASDNATTTIAGLTFLAAVEDNVPVTEVSIDGRARGAASHALARALEGAADQAGNRDGVTTRGELFGFLRTSIRSVTGHRQSPVVEPRSVQTAAVALFKHGNMASLPTVTVAAATTTLAPTVAAPGHLGGDGPVTRDAYTGNVRAADGTIVVYGGSIDAFEGARARAAALPELNRLAAGSPFALDLRPADGRVHVSEQFELLVPSGLYGRYLILVSLAGDGTVQLLFPTGRVDPYRSEDSLKQVFTAGPAPSFDTLILIAADSRRTPLERALADLGATRDAPGLVHALSTLLGANDRIGMVSYMTLPRR